MSEGSEETFREYRGTKVRRYDAEVRVPGGVLLAEESLSLRRNLDFFFGLIEKNLGSVRTRARRAAREQLSGNLFAMIDRLIALAEQKRDKVSAQWASRVLSVLVSRCICPLIGIAEGKVEGEGKRSAGESLARVEEVLGKHAKKLDEVNLAYVETKAQLQELGRRRDVVADPGVIGQIVQKELAVAQLYWKWLRFSRRLFGDGWEKEISTEIPREYFAFEPLPAFCEKSCEAWWQLLWPLIKKHNPDFLVGVRAGLFPTLGIRMHARWSRYGDDFRDPLEALARLRS